MIEVASDTGSFVSVNTRIRFLRALDMRRRDSLPELARGLGQSLGEFKKARDEFERELGSSTTEVDVKPTADKQPYKEPADKQPHQAS
jgi:hypothetical protein